MRHNLCLFCIKPVGQLARLIVEIAQVRIENERLRLAVKRVGGGKVK